MTVKQKDVVVLIDDEIKGFVVFHDDTNDKVFYCEKDKDEWTELPEATAAEKKWISEERYF